MANYRRVARREAIRAGIDPKVFERQINKESGFNKRAKSPAGAEGIAQFMPGTAAAEHVDPWNPRSALRGAARLDAKLIHQTGSYRKALAAYNAGPGNIPAGLGYADSILHGHVPSAPKGGGGSRTKVIPGVDRSQDRKRLLATYLLSQDGIGAAPSDPLDPTSAAATSGTDLTSTLLKIARTRDTPARKIKVAGGGGGKVIPGGHYPLAHKGKIIGTPYQGTHARAFNAAGGSNNWESENAVDIAARKGTPVRAVADGVIGSQIGSLGQGGRFAGLRLHLRTNGNEYYYAHLSKLSVHAGQRVKKGQILGYSGEANGVQHLHFADAHGDPRRLTG